MYALDVSCADVPELKQIQAFKKNKKRASIAGVHIKVLYELMLHCKKAELSLPTVLTELVLAQRVLSPSGAQPLILQSPGQAVAPSSGPGSTLTNGPCLRRDMFYIPLSCGLYNCEGATFTGPMQIQWIGQLVKRHGNFILHMDGKHKLHHGDWMLITIGTHHLRCLVRLARLVRL